MLEAPFQEGKAAKQLKPGLPKQRPPHWCFNLVVIGHHPVTPRRQPSPAGSRRVRDLVGQDEVTLTSIETERDAAAEKLQGIFGGAWLCVTMSRSSSQFKDSPIGCMPMQWSLCRLADFLDAIHAGRVQAVQTDPRLAMNGGFLSYGGSPLWVLGA